MLYPLLRILDFDYSIIEVHHQSLTDQRVDSDHTVAAEVFLP